MAIKKPQGRQAEAIRIRRANRAAAVGRLMLGQTHDWEEFLEPDVSDLESLPRRKLKTGITDVKKNVSQEIKRFCGRNFENMTEAKLDKLYERIKQFRGLEIPLAEFESTYSKVNRKVLRSAPPHCTVVISLWGLQFKYPEDNLGKDILQALTTALDAHEKLEGLKGQSHELALQRKETIATLIRQKDFACRSCLLFCFNLVEAYLNGIAWDFAQDPESLRGMSNRERSLITDARGTTLRDKIIKYPKIITGRRFLNEEDETVSSFLTLFKPFRDSLVHPSPFSAPDKFGGYNKLRHFYGIDIPIIMWTCKVACDLIVCIHRHINGVKIPPLDWLSDLLGELDNYEFTGMPYSDNEI